MNLRLDQILGSRVSPEIRRRLKLRKAWQEARGRAFLIRMRRQIEPRGVERAAMRAYRDRLRILRELVAERLLPRIEAWLREKRSTRLNRADAMADELSVVLEGIKVEFLRRYSTAELQGIATRIGLAVSQHNLRELNKTMRSAIDVDVFQAEPYLQSEMENFVAQNVGLINTVDERYFREIEQEVFAGARQGLQTQEIASKIRDRGDVAQSRADLIARDQVNKFNGQLSQLRQENLGVEKYRWRTSLDERVRPEHKNREGKIFSWDDPPSDGHPGEPIQCRCYAEPVLEDLIEEE